MDISEVEISLEMFSDFFFNKVFRTEDRQGEPGNLVVRHSVPI